MALGFPTRRLSDPRTGSNARSATVTVFTVMVASSRASVGPDQNENKDLSSIGALSVPYLKAEARETKKTIKRCYFIQEPSIIDNNYFFPTARISAGP
jgi:hypothetical protein